MSRFLLDTDILSIFAKASTLIPKSTYTDIIAQTHLVLCRGAWRPGCRGEFSLAPVLPCSPAQKGVGRMNVRELELAYARQQQRSPRSHWWWYLDELKALPQPLKERADRLSKAFAPAIA